MYHPAWNHRSGSHPGTQKAVVQYLPLDQRGGLGHVDAMWGGLAGVDTVVDAMWSRPARVAASLVLGFHGYRRNNSILWALVWAALGAASPPFSTMFALAMQPGFARRKGR